ncbi:hypothetical protein [Bacillus sp. FJAT-44742]|nr:hypothetical protein [Bacillus sp. FJAT-44742]
MKVVKHQQRLARTASLFVGEQKRTVEGWRFFYVQAYSIYLEYLN